MVETPLRWSLSTSEIDIPALYVGAEELDLQIIADVESLLSLHEHTLHARIQNPNKGSLRACASDNCVKGLPNAAGHRDRGHTLGHFALHLSSGIFSLSAVSSDRFELGIGVGICVAGEFGLDQTLGDKIGETAVGCGRVRVVLHSETEVALGWVAWPLENILAGPH